jgi:single-stranded-DNA-specific exonuclease
LIETMQKVEPFGEGNRRPVFVSRNLQVASCDLVGQTHSHVRCLLRDAAGRSQRFIGFNLGSRAAELSPGTAIDVAYEIGVNEWNGRRDIQCKLLDMKQAHNAASDR